MELDCLQNLQERLAEMEKENPSPSLEGARPTLKDRVYFGFRGLINSFFNEPSYGLREFNKELEDAKKYSEVGEDIKTLEHLRAALELQITYRFGDSAMEVYQLINAYCNQRLESAALDKVQDAIRKRDRIVALTDMWRAKSYREHAEIAD